MSINKSINLFKNEFSVETKLYKIRNKTIAHIEADIKEYFDIVYAMDYDRSVEMIFRFLLILRDMEEVSIGCMTVAGPAIPQNFDIQKTFDDLSTRLLDFKNRLSSR